ncbi:MAG: hypothetical protein LBF85_09035, partial [Tannerella sp.]|nr:hypothetical protein [Tannerella sp.]
AITQKGEYHQQFPEMRKTHCLSTLSSNSVIGRSVATWQSSTGREPGLLRLTATGDMFRYLLTVSLLDCFLLRASQSQGRRMPLLTATVSSTGAYRMSPACGNENYVL